MRLTLAPHPDTPCEAVRGIAVEVLRSGTRLDLGYRVEGDIGQILLPERGVRGRADDLWKHTCFEAFIRAGQGYGEINLSPSDQWAAYGFESYRQGMSVREGFELSFAEDYRAANAYDLIAELDLTDLPAGDVWSVGLSAVIELTDGRRCFWALNHAPGPPDFHHPDAFALSLPAEFPMKFGIDRLLEDASLRAPLKGRRLALLAHPASVTADLTHSLDALAACPDLTLTAAFGPQHGMRGDKQDNMMESPDFNDPVHGIPVFSLYGEVRRPLPAWMDTFDIMLVDLQDLGCRIYTFITTLLYVLEAAAEHGKTVWVLDRPNPAGRPVEGLTLLPGWESFVGAGPMPMRHGLTLGELGRWFIDHYKLDVDYRVIEMQGYDPEAAPGHGWPLGERTWVNPSPNAPNLWMARAYAGTVMLEGATLSEGRGTTRPLELFGAPDIDARKVIEAMRDLAPQWLSGCTLREIWFEPTFHKHMKTLCSGVQIHTEGPEYHHAAFKPWRLQALAFKAIRRLYPDYDLWRDFPYEYVLDRLAIDVINGGPGLREWVDDPAATPADLNALTVPDEQAWEALRAPYLLY